MDAPVLKNGLLILHGYNAGLQVWNRQLVCKYGTGEESGKLQLGKADTSGRLRHIVIMGGDGYLTTQALRWLDSVEISLTIMQNNGQVLMSWGKVNHPYATLARSQALAVYQETGLTIAQWLITEKLRGQAETLDGLRMPSEPIRREMRDMVRAKSIQDVMVREARSAAYYWGRLEGMRLTFARQNRQRLPSNWLTLGARISPLSRKAMHAATPGQAVLNYLYGVAESVCAIALTSVGLDPEVGIIHTDTDYRRSMALDLIEPIRPQIDRLAFDLLQNQVFSKSDFWETDRGSVRLGLEVRRSLIRNAFLVENRALDFALRLRQRLSTSERGVAKRRTIRPGELEILQRCKYCGVPLPANRRQRRAVCRNCAQLARQEWHTPGNKPGYEWSQEAVEKHSETSRARQREIAKWEAQFPPNELADVVQRERQRFIAEIMPKLRTGSVSQIARAAGISRRYASLIKQGRNVPHPCLYAKFEACCSPSGGQADAPRRRQQPRALERSR